MPDHDDGYVQRKKGVLRTDLVMAKRYYRRAKHDRVRFDASDCNALLRAAQETCEAASRGWRFHLGVAVFNHVHLLISWPAYADARQAKATLHRALTVALRDLRGGAARRPFLSRGGSAKRVSDHAHFNHLVDTYLPSHKKYGGIILAPCS